MKLCTIVFVVLAAATIDCRAQEPPTGQLLHETYCVGCHDSRVYTREDRLARDYREILAQVRRWQQNVGLKWSDADIERVSSHIAAKYYKLPCPDAC